MQPTTLVINCTLKIHSRSCVYAKSQKFLCTLAEVYISNNFRFYEVYVFRDLMKLFDKHNFRFFFLLLLFFSSGKEEDESTNSLQFSSTFAASVSLVSQINDIWTLDLYIDIAAGITLEIIGLKSMFLCLSHSFLTAISAILIIDF